VRDEVRLLGRTSGYTSDPSRALPGEPEAVDRSTQQRFTLEAARNWPRLSSLQTQERREAPTHVRLQRAEAQARVSGIDVHRELRLTRLAIEAGRPAAHVERRLQVLEARVYPR